MARAMSGQNFPSFSERLLLRRDRAQAQREPEERRSFPFPFGGAFIEVFLLHSTGWVFLCFLAETFIEATSGSC